MATIHPSNQPINIHQSPRQDYELDQIPITCYQPIGIYSDIIPLNP